MKSWLLLVAAFLLCPCCSSQNVEDTCEKVFVLHGYFALRKQHFRINEEARYLCHDGYTTPEGGTEGQTQCLKEGWVPKPNCTKTCSKPRADTYILNTTKPVFLSGDELQYECKEGFETIKKTIGDTVVCSEEGWEPTPVCLPIECETPFLDNGMINPREDKFLHKMVVHFKCRRGFTRVGSESAQCYHFGWSPQPPICKENVKTCQTSPSILHGMVIGDLKEVYQHGDNLEVQCDISFALYGSKIIECVDGEWAPLPSCTEEVKTCGPPPNIRNGAAINVESSTYRHGETVEYQCQPLSIITGTNPAKCLHGQWELPSCLVNPRKCRRPWQAVFEPEVRFFKQFKTNTFATYRCGSNLHETKCVDGVWFPEPLCKETCPPPPQLPSATNIAEMRIYRSGEEISFRCKEHFFLHGPQKIKCEDGKWQTPPCCLGWIATNPVDTPGPTGRTTGFAGSVVKTAAGGNLEVADKGTRSAPNDIRDLEVRWAKVLRQEAARLSAMTDLGGTCGRPPTVDNGDILETPKANYYPYESVTYQCQHLYKMGGSPRVTCQNGHWTEKPTCIVPCIASEEDLRQHNIMLKWTQSDKIYSEDGNVIEFQCKRGYQPDPNSRPFRVTCINGKFDYPHCSNEASSDNAGSLANKRR